MRSQQEKDQIHRKVCLELIASAENGDFGSLGRMLLEIDSDTAKVRVIYWLKSKLNLRVEKGKKGSLSIGFGRRVSRSQRRLFWSELRSRLRQGFYGRWYSVQLMRGSTEWKRIEVVLGIRKTKSNTGTSVWTVSGGLPGLGKRR